MCSAANRIERITYFEEPLPDADHGEYILAQSWKEAEVECGVDTERTGKIDTYVSRIAKYIVGDTNNPYAVAEYPISYKIRSYI